MIKQLSSTGVEFVKFVDANATLSPPEGYTNSSSDIEALMVGQYRLWEDNDVNPVKRIAFEVLKDIWNSTGDESIDETLRVRKIWIANEWGSFYITHDEIDDRITVTAGNGETGYTDQEYTHSFTRRTLGILSARQLVPVEVISPYTTDEFDV